MSKNTVSDFITDQEMTFARLILSGTMTDREAAEAAGLHPTTAAYTKSRPRVRAYMVEHRAAVEQKLVEHEADEALQLNQTRKQVLARLWEIANMSSDVTRNSMSSQVKALSMIVAIEGLVPDRRNGSTRQEFAPSPTPPAFYRAAPHRKQEETTSPEPLPASAPPEPAAAPVANPGEFAFTAPRPTTSWVPGSRFDAAPLQPFSTNRPPSAY